MTTLLPPPSSGPNQFRTAQGNLKLLSLFYEDIYKPDDAIYTIRDQDKEAKGYLFPSLYKLYMAEADITEYNFANKYFESYQHWRVICESDWFKPYLQRWREELELKVKSEALKEIIAQANSSDPRKRLEASKYLFEKVYVDRGAGRPSKKKIKEEAMIQARQDKIITEDFERIVKARLQ